MGRYGNKLNGRNNNIETTRVSDMTIDEMPRSGKNEKFKEEQEGEFLIKFFFLTRCR